MLEELFNAVRDAGFSGLAAYYTLIMTGALAAAVMIYLKTDKINCENKVKRRVYVAFIAAGAVGFFCSNAFKWFFIPNSFDFPFFERVLRSGFTFFVGMLTFFGSALLILKLLKQNAGFWVERAVPPVAAFNAISRVGCIFLGCCGGIHIDADFFGIRLEHFPVIEIEIAVMTVLFFILADRKKRNVKNKLFWYLLVYCVLRFFLEFVREDRGAHSLAGLNVPQLIALSVLAVLAASLIINYAKTKKLFKEKTPPPPVNG
ncbi:MAG: prolipoprotein diacylglyceryl transferase [Clostridiales bacterium]|jgi:phosphatidylglycerol:prolipoprotein diacylglycerol transferase|nr:prolipoprotein diacylglyceryl transferase [Clostridiales bacterium]